MIRELLWGLHTVSQELDTWRRRASTVPDSQIRDDALRSIDHKRENAEGAGLFWTLPSQRDKGLVGLLVAYQTLWDFLDNLSERGASAGEINGHQLHLALTEALDPRSPASDYYCHHFWKQDGGYLPALVDACRWGCIELPAYSQIRSPMHFGVAKCSVQSLNHDPEPARRDAALKRWASRESPGPESMSWFELTAAASAFTPHPLLAMAAESSCCECSVRQVYDAYYPWVSLAIAMLDSYADQLDDAATDNHSYISHYGDDEAAIGRLCEIVERALCEVRGLHNGSRHSVLVASMVAMYLSKEGARAPTMRDQTRRVARAGGYLTRFLLPLLRGWRLIHNRRLNNHEGENEINPR